MKLIVADDHPMVRAGLMQILVRLADKVEFVEAVDYATTREAMLNSPDADLVLMDLSMPGMNGADSIAALLACAPTLPLAVVSATTSVREMRETLTAGAAGFVGKHESPEVLLGALQLVLAGGIYVPPSLATAAPAEYASAPALTQRQKEVLTMMVAGNSNKEIARDLGLAEQTVKGYLLTIFRLLDVRNRVEAAEAARRLGIVR